MANRTKSFEIWWETSPSFLLDHSLSPVDLDSKQLSPSDYLTRQSLYNRPVAFEKDSRSWARSLLGNFKKTNKISPSSSFEQHIQYIEHINDCNDYPAYLEYLNDNRSQLFYTLTDSLDIIDGLLGTVVSSFWLIFFSLSLFYFVLFQRVIIPLFFRFLLLLLLDRMDKLKYSMNKSKLHLSDHTYQLQ